MAEALADVFKMLSHGVYVIGVSDGERENAFTAAWVMQTSFNPPMLVISINPDCYSYRLLKAGGVCSVNVLGQEQLDIAAHFGQRGIADKMAGHEWFKSKTGAPILSAALAYFDCRLSHMTDAGDHKLAVCEVISATTLRKDIPLLYSQTGEMDGSQSLYKENISGSN